MPNLIPQSEPLLKVVIQDEHHRSIKISQSLKNFVVNSQGATEKYDREVDQERLTRGSKIN